VRPAQRRQVREVKELKIDFKKGLVGVVLPAGE
jgi:hypothetical protein